MGEPRRLCAKRLEHLDLRGAVGDMVFTANDVRDPQVDIIAGNVANTNTSGYTRETPTWKESTPVTINGLAFGTGVTQTGAQSLRDRVLLERLNQQQELSSASSSRLDALNNIQALFTPATDASSSNAGELGTDLTSFFNAFSSLEVNPTNNALRQQVFYLRMHIFNAFFNNKFAPFNFLCNFFQCSNCCCRFFRSHQAHFSQHGYMCNGTCHVVFCQQEIKFLIAAYGKLVDQCGYRSVFFLPEFHVAAKLW